MYIIRTTREFDVSLRRCIRQGRDIKIFRETAEILAEHGSLPPEYNPHMLSGQFEGYWECHISSDWLLIWDQNDCELTLLMTDTGTHSDLFGK